MIRDHDTIAAPATAAGGALAVIRISGEEALRICDRIFRGRKPLAAAAGYTVHYGEIVDDGRVLDDVLVTVFRAPRSYTGEDAAEISCHGSQYIVSEILRLLTASGARMAGPGEFTIRAYLAGKLDLSQAEAVADIIASSSRAAHALAANQMRGGYSDALEGLCEKLLELTALLELELDFSEEEVEFADRAQLREAMQRSREPRTSARAPCSTVCSTKSASWSRTSRARHATSSRSGSTSTGSSFGSSTRRASAQRTTGWNRWASSARCRASSGRRS